MASHRFEQLLKDLCYNESKAAHKEAKICENFLVRSIWQLKASKNAIYPIKSSLDESLYL